MNNNRLHLTLRKDLAKRTVKKYSVTQYCKTLGIGRSAFYNQYDGMPGLICHILKHEIALHFREYQDCSLKQLVYGFLKEIYDLRVYYNNIYHLSIKNNCKRHICKEIKNKFFKELQQYLIKSDYSNKKILSISSVTIYRVKDWVSHGCKESILQIYSEIEPAL